MARLVVEYEIDEGRAEHPEDLFFTPGCDPASTARSISGRCEEVLTGVVRVAAARWKR